MLKNRVIAVSAWLRQAGQGRLLFMPRYNIARPDARDLIAYLKVIQDDFDPGVSTDEIVVGTLQPGQPLQDRLGDAMIAVMQDRFDDFSK